MSDVISDTPGARTPKPIRRFARRVKRLVRLTVVVVVVLLGALEVWLRALAHAPPRPSATAAAHRRVLCVGDSYTYGVGAPRGESYPDHLRRLLGDGWAVVNEGWPGSNSSMMAERLPAWLSEDRPDVVIVMAGMNNQHNPLGGTYRRLVQAGYVRPTAREALSHRLDLLLWRLRVYRLLRWTVVDRLTRAPVADASATSPTAVGRPAGIHWSAQTADDPVLASATDGALRALDRGERDAALRSLRTAFAGVRSCERVAEPFINQLRDLRDRLSPAEYDTLTATLRASMPAADYATCVEGPFFLEGDAALQQKMLWYDLDQMRLAAARHGAQLVVLTYPWRFSAYAEVQESFAMNRGIPLIVPRLPPWYTMTDLAAPNGRLSSAGNRWLAEQVLAQGRSLGLFPTSPR
jgi:hypothetical protein